MRRHSRRCQIFVSLTFPFFFFYKINVYYGFLGGGSFVSFLRAQYIQYLISRSVAQASSMLDRYSMRRANENHGFSTHVYSIPIVISVVEIVILQSACEMRPGRMPCPVKLGVSPPATVVHLRKLPYNPASPHHSQNGD